MIPKDSDEFENRLAAGTFDSEIHQILTDIDLDEDVETAPQLPSSTSNDETLVGLVEHGLRLGRSRLLVSHNFLVERLLFGIDAGQGEQSLTLAGPPIANLGPEDVPTNFVNALFAFGPRLKLTFGAEVEGTPLELVLIARPKATRAEFDRYIAFEKPKTLLSKGRFDQLEGNAVGSIGPALFDIALPSTAENPQEATAPIARFDVAVDFAAFQLVVSTLRQDGEDSVLTAMVQFDGGLPAQVTLECDEFDRRTLRGTVPLPKSVKEQGQMAAIVGIREVTANDLPLLPPHEVSLWLASQQAIAVPLVADQDGFILTLDEPDRCFLTRNLDSIVALRIESEK